MSIGPSTQRPPWSPFSWVTKYCTQNVLKWEISSKETSRDSQIIAPLWPPGTIAGAWIGQRARHSLRGKIKPGRGGPVLKYIWEVPKYISVFCLTSDSPPLSHDEGSRPGRGHLWSGCGSWRRPSVSQKPGDRKALLFLAPPPLWLVNCTVCSQRGLPPWRKPQFG